MQNIHNTLQEIIAKKRADLSMGSVNRFRSAILKAENFAVIAEIKLASPTIGQLGSKNDILRRVFTYEKSEVSALSVITEPHFFHGDVRFISRIKRISQLPILQKDFVVDPYQVYEAKVIGADALLFIARIVSKTLLNRLVRLAQSVGVEPVVEVNDEDDLEKALNTSTAFIAVNARDLRTFEVDVDRACEVMKKIPKRYIKLGFSGIHSSIEVKKYAHAGAKGVLVGTALMKADNIHSFIKELRNP